MLKENLTEEQTRKKIIDGLLEKAGWHLNNRSEVSEEFEIEGAGAVHTAQEPEDFNPSGFSDYLLFDRAGNPLAVVEAKRTSRDPIEGKQQAYRGGFKKHLPNEARCWIKSGEIDTGCRLFVATIQTMMECFHKISPGFFDVIISDECHRSIYNKWKDVLSYFHSGR
ncbi:hypothetical protein AUJ66_02875 [Candidatus Desantisbacteria bacterium CG1_02_38_46]|uniref:Helicase/UvrB N-terminal domain-containing protein n=1 Tax=Candidatus Desantisbacteria bacterium CG1_02_38_46 TaxID=1817893 RepID=A0A1J4SFW3_9BACT|nr:MAG: hypothetical protein AUJ66_02875 [Candidatus Desantisbacteria bacterium CG1_02_38_46]